MNKKYKLLSALQVWRLEQNTAPNAKTEQIINAKISDNALKQWSRTRGVVGWELVPTPFCTCNLTWSAWSSTNE